MFPLIHDPLNISSHISLLFSWQTNFTALHRGGGQVTTASTASSSSPMDTSRSEMNSVHEREGPVKSAALCTETVDSFVRFYFNFAVRTRLVKGAKEKLEKMARETGNREIEP